MFADKSNGIITDKLLSLGGKYGVYMIGAGFARLIRNSVIEGASEQQVYIGEQTTNASLISSWIGNGNGAAHPRTKGILMEPSTSFITIANNRIGDQPGNAIHSLATNVVIDSNQIMFNGYGGGYDSVLIEQGRNVTVRGNHIASSTDLCAISVRNSSTKIIVKDNINEYAGPTVCLSGSGTRIVADNIP